jgi:hypothetical protein
MRVHSPLPVAAAAAIGLCACAKKPAPATPATANVVTITATDFAFAAPDTIPAGLTTFLLINHGQEPHQAILARLDSGKTMADMQALLQSPGVRPPAWLAFPGGPNTAIPGDSANATEVLVPGHYVLLCFIQSPDGKPHFAKGMMHAMEVAPSNAPVAPEPTADLVITEKDYTFDVSAPITAGTHTIRVENAGPQLHEVTIFQLVPGKTAADFQSWMQGGMQGPPPAKPYGGFVGPDSGGHGFFTASFTPGDYVLTCFVPDRTDGKPHAAHGMIKPFTVS